MVAVVVSNARITPVWKGAYVDNPPGTPDTGDPVTEPFGSGGHITRLSPYRSGDYLRVRATLTVSGWSSTTNAGQRMYALIRVGSQNVLANPYSDGFRRSNGTITVDINIPSSRMRDDGATYIYVEGGLFTEGANPSNANPINRYGTVSTTAWANRTPEAPTITSPSTGTTVAYDTDIASVISVDWALGADPDRLTSQTLPGFNSPEKMDDYGGYHLQVRQMPTVSNPNPAWSNNLGDLQVVGESLGFWTNRSASLIADPTYVDATSTQKMRLGPGAWQVRVRTFDQSGRVNSIANRDPSVASNVVTGSASPWSNIVTIYVTAAFLPPEPVSPVGNIAVAVSPDGPVDFEWQFLEPRASGGSQARRRLRVRRADQDPVDMVTNLATNPSLESGGVTSGTGWLAGSTLNTVTRVNVGSSGSYAGTHRVTVQRNATGPYDSFIGSVQALGHSDTARPTAVPGQPVSVRSHARGFSSGSSSDVRVGIEWLDASGVRIGSIAFGSYRTIVGIAYQSVDVSAVAPAGAVTLRAWAEGRLTSGTASSSSLFYMDGTIITATATPVPYFDGNSPGAQWIGTQNSSASTMEAWDEIIPEASQASSSQRYTYTNGTTFTFVPGQRYEWQARTVSTPGDYDSGWSQSAFFYAVDEPDSGPIFPDSDVLFPSPGLGSGHNRAFLYQRGGIVPIGEIKDFTFIQWARERDEISQARVVISVDDGAEPSQRALLRDARSWLHEIVVFRESHEGAAAERVWEGPITRITYEKGRVELAAHDVMVYVYRRIMRQGYNDAFRVRGRTYFEGGGINEPGTVISQPLSVTIRSSRIIQNALSYDDPNVLRYLTIRSQADDAKQSRVVPDFSRSAWQQVDDLGAKSGLDYTTVGRRIIVWDTHNALGTLPEMRDGDFDNPPIVTEYGMQAANVYAVTNNSGVYGVAEAEDPMFEDYGYIEMVNSAWGEEDEGGSDLTLTAEAREALEETMNEQADRNIGSRWPVPVIVRVPDNSTLSPDVQVTINQLVPGVFIPLRSDVTLREVAGMQKLDRIIVQQDAKGERVQVTMSPAPRGRGDDPDAGGGEV